MKYLVSTAAFAATLALAAAAAAKAPPPAKPAAPAVSAEAPTVASLGSFNDGFKFGMTRAELTQTVVGPNGLVDKDFDPQLRHASAGVQQRALEAERDAVKQSFVRNTTEFNAIPSGLDSGPMGKEYTYGNHESLMILPTSGKKRYYFFINDRLWKVYDEVLLGGPAALGATFNEIDAKLATKFAAQPRRAPQYGYSQLDWQDQTTHLRVVDRTSEKIVGIVLEDRGILAQLPSLRTAKLADPFAIDPSITAVTKSGLSDPNKQVPQTPPPEEKPAKKKPRR